MELAVILMTIALVVFAILITVGGAHLVDLANKYVESETDRRTLLTEVASIKAGNETLAADKKTLHGIVTDLNRKLAALRAETVGSLSDAALTDALNGVRSDEVRGPVHRESASEDTAPHRAAARSANSPGRSVPK